MSSCYDTVISSYMLPNVTCAGLLNSPHKNLQAEYYMIYVPLHWLQGYGACTWESEQSPGLMVPKHVQLLLCCVGCAEQNAWLHLCAVWSSNVLCCSPYVAGLGRMHLGERAVLRAYGPGACPAACATRFRCYMLLLTSVRPADLQHKLDSALCLLCVAGL